jgi:hypothetical protein
LADSGSTSPRPPDDEHVRLDRRLEFDFEVGATERHRVYFYFDQFWGNVKIEVDGKRVIRDFRFISFRTRKRYRFSVGETERHDVVIEKSRKLVIAGARQQVCRVFVDGNLVGEHGS